MRRYLYISSVALSIAAPLSAQVSTGSPTAYVGPFGTDVPGAAVTAVAQTFLVPAGSSYLQSFTVYFTQWLNGSAVNINASVYQFDTDHLVGTALFMSALVSGTDSFGDDLRTFGGDPEHPLNILLSPATTYALVLSTLDGNAATPDGAAVGVGVVNDVYARGNIFYSFADARADLFTPAAFLSDPSTDAAFSANFTEGPVTATPEPASLVLMATGMAGVGGVVHRRARRKKSEALLAG